MKLPSSFLIAASAIAASVVMTACGGGADSAGSPTAFTVVPAELTLSVPEGNPGGLPEGTCNATAGGWGRVYVYGGTAPYRIDNTAPNYVTVDRGTVEHRGDFFQVDFTGGCTTGSIVVIVDALDHQVHLTLNNEPAKAATN